jgi:large subunit ribosomal protein L10
MMDVNEEANNRDKIIIGEREVRGERVVRGERMVREKPIPDFKIKAVDEISELLKKNKTVLIASIKNLPASQFQEISKSLRGKAVVKVPKKSISLRAIEKIEEGAIMSLKDHIHEDISIIFANLDAFELSSELVQMRKPAKAKAGQEAPGNIIIEPGPTDLLPGPAISELGALGLRVAVEDGKISIKERKVLVKKGEIISESAAGLMAKLGIKPFKIGFEPLVAYDTEDEKLYTDIKIDKEEALNLLKTSFSKAFGLAININYTTEETIKFLIGKAGSYEKALSALINEPTDEKNEKLDESDEKLDESDEKLEKAPEEKTMEDVIESKSEEVVEKTSEEKIEDANSEAKASNKNIDNKENSKSRDVEQTQQKTSDNQLTKKDITSASAEANISEPEASAEEKIKPTSKEEDKSEEVK